MRISDWSSDVCSSDLAPDVGVGGCDGGGGHVPAPSRRTVTARVRPACPTASAAATAQAASPAPRSEEHTSELQSLMRISYAVFCLKTKKDIKSFYNLSSFLFFISSS